MENFSHNALDLPNNGICTFSKKPVCNNLDILDADFAIIGMPFELGNNCRCGTKMAPRAIREASTLYCDKGQPQYDFERDRLYLGPNHKIVDCGDIDVVPGDVIKSMEIIEKAIDKILDKGALPIGMGGDDTIPIPFAKSLLKKQDIFVVQIDAHLDWTASGFGGQKYCQSTNMRRISEFDGVKGIAQLSLRGLGSSRKQDFEDAREFGTVILSARQFKKMGVEKVLEMIPEGENYYINLDIDGMDPSIAPGTTTPAPGGLDYYEASDLFEGLANKGRIAGLTVVEVSPPYDCGNITSQLAARLMLDVILFASNGKG